MPRKRSSRQRSRGLLLAPLESRILFSFGLTTSANLYTVDTGANLVFSVARTTAGSASVGDLTSTRFNGTELEAPHSATGRYSHYESGLSSSTSVTAAIDPNGQWIAITCNDTGGTGVIQYYIARKGDNNLYMATYAGSASAPSPGEMRFIMYLNWNIFTNHPAASDNSSSTGAIESSDVFGNSATGTTSSKYYGENPAITTPYYGATGTSGGNGYGAFMFIGNRETSSGGPFYKDIDFQGTGAAEELYNYVFSGHSQTEDYRPGLKGPYAIQFTDGSQPSAPDYGFISQIGVQGYVGPSGRGTLTGNASGAAAGMTPTVGLSNAADQYWVTPDSSGNYTLTGILPGTYTETLYQNQLAVGTTTVTITAGAVTRANIVSTLYTPPEIWSIGSFDGTPNEFLNADKIQDMHPSDSRMAAWADATGLSTYTIGASAPGSFPMAEWKQFNTSSDPNDTDITINFTLTAAQAATPLTFRIGMTRSGAGGRPGVSVNGHTATYPGSPTQPTSRGITTGNWQGNYVLETYALSTSQLHAGANTLDISVVSGSSNTDAWLGPWIVFDALDLVTTASLTNAPVVKSIDLTPANPLLPRNAQQQFTAIAKDQNGNPTPANFTWATTVGAIDGAGLLTAPPNLASGTITATSGAISGSTSVAIVPAAPALTSITINDGSAQRSMVTSITLDFSAPVALSGGAISLYQRSATGGSPMPISFTLTPAAGDTTFAASYVLTFSGAGGSLADGIYDLSVNASGVHDAYNQALVSGSTLTFHRLLGDSDGDGDVDNLDALRFKGAQGSLSGGGNYKSYFDFDSDGDIDNLDALRFKLNEGKIFNY